MSKRILIIILLIFYISYKGYSQNNIPYFVSVEPSYGRMIIPENSTLFNDQITGLDISIAKSMKHNSSEWVKRMSVAYQLLSLTYMNQSKLDGMLDTSKNSFGNVYMLTYSLMINLIGKKKNHFYFIPGWGIAYDTKTFFDEPKNIYIGSHFNYSIRLEGMFEKYITDRFSLLTSIKYMHYSNGSFILPNRGINSVSYKLGLAYHFNK